MLPRGNLPIAGLEHLPTRERRKEGYNRISLNETTLCLIPPALTLCPARLQRTGPMAFYATRIWASSCSGLYPLRTALWEGQVAAQLPHPLHSTSFTWQTLFSPSKEIAS